jgi:tripartite-type tricarboxylate transporter receptor subunit TctC
LSILISEVPQAKWRLTMFRNVFTLVISGILVLLSTSSLFAQKYPDRPITLVIPMAPGDGLDVAGRLMGEELSKLLKVPVVPLNKPGATATLGTDMVVKAKKDGYTILLTNSASLVNAKVLQPEIVPYDPLKDLTPLGMSTVWPMVFVIRNNAPYKDLKELVEFMKKNPGKIRCGTAGVKSISDFNVELFKMLSGVEMTAVPFKGASPSVTAVVGGHVEAGSLTITPYLSHIRSGEVKAIVTSKTFSEFPDIPTLKQLGYNRDLIDVWGAFFTPAGVPPQVIETLVPALEKVVRDPEIYAKLAKAGMYQDYLPPDKLVMKMQDEYKIVEEVAKRYGMMK